MKLSIIIPVYNEAAHICELLRYLQNNLYDAENCEILVIDGGSTDGTALKVTSFSNDIQLLHSVKGRGAQMNFGANTAKGETLYFLHADSFPPKYFDKYINDQVKKGNLAGCFKMKFDSNHWWLFLASWFTQFNLKFFRGGDQSLFVDKKLFKKLRGFPEDHPIFEDFELIRLLYKTDKFTVISHWITSSSRRYKENGVAKLQYHYWILYIKKWFGASTDDLVSYYKKNIN